MVVLPRDCAGPGYGSAEPDVARGLTIRHPVAWPGVELGGETPFGAHLGPGDGYTWPVR